ncbi:DUF4345 domain-containing protein [Dyadobacter sp. CY343]|uniref:DUF4345 domain-containing protein n=1 Tax=Dyadobacter sp. CY343 TaxID=2907299 RepID=UPI001F187CEE|nr:DUF4345 domain-containing protein [Dyadobacter sp. CY343]MCE7059452.1 DUF4345 domain-containing protein [Dyadobacter sp. CY343]
MFKSKRALQIVIAILAAAPLVSGILGLAGIYNPLFSETLPADLVLDSNLRFLNAVSVAVAIAFYCILPVIEKETFACRVICSAILLGGLARLISIYELGIPPFFISASLILELLSPILIMYWQRRIAVRVIRDKN